MKKPSSEFPASIAAWLIFVAFLLITLMSGCQVTSSELSTVVDGRWLCRLVWPLGC